MDTEHFILRPVSSDDDDEFIWNRLRNDGEQGIEFDEHYDAEFAVV